MKIISLWQPWASLIAIGAKRHETRSWATPYRGTLLIHAAKKWSPEQRALCLEEPFRTALYGSHHPYPEVMPLGVILATCHVSRCIRTDVCGDFPEAERAFGDYSPGRYAWRLEDVVRLPEPIPLRGRQGLWDAPAEVCDAIADQLRGVVTP